MREEHHQRHIIGTITITIIFVTIVITIVAITITITISTVNLFIERTVIADKSFATLATQSRPRALKSPGQNGDDGEEMVDDTDDEDDDGDDVDYDCNDNEYLHSPQSAPTPHWFGQTAREQEVPDQAGSFHG